MWIRIQPVSFPPPSIGETQIVELIEGGGGLQAVRFEKGENLAIEGMRE